MPACEAASMARNSGERPPGCLGQIVLPLIGGVIGGLIAGGTGAIVGFLLVMAWITYIELSSKR
jgi:hypothetical protein